MRFPTLWLGLNKLAWLAACRTSNQYSPLLHLCHPTQGISTPEDCVPEFPTDGNLPSYLPWDIIPGEGMEGKLLAEQTRATTQTACQALCSNNPKCMYVVYYNYVGAVANSTAKCFLRLAPADIAPVALNADTTWTVAFEVGVRAGAAPSALCGARLGSCAGAAAGAAARMHAFRIKTLILTTNPPHLRGAHPQVKQGVYAAYSTLGEEGTTIVADQPAGYPIDTLDIVKAYCDATPACIGMHVNGDNTLWRPFGGVKWADAVGKVRVVGEAIATYSDATATSQDQANSPNPGQGASQPN